MTDKERKLAEDLLARGYTHLYRDEEERIYAQSGTKVMLIDSTYFTNIASKIPIDVLIGLDAGVEIPVLYREKQVIKYRNNISKDRLKYWLELLKEGPHAELRRQLEKEIAREDK
jgi:hypothetical protein